MTWDVRTNIKAKPGSQGTLFQGGSDQMTDAKWPRHYTPERLAEAHEAVSPSKRVLRDRPGMGKYDTNPDTRRLIDTVARSTVPAEHLQRLQFSPGKLPEEMNTGSGDAQMTADGLYTRPRSPRGNAHISVRQGMADNPVAIHEIGHHASFLAGGADFGNRTKMGREEGKADAYAQEHFRDRRGRSTSFDGYRYMQPDSLRNAEFFASYHGTRPREREFSPYRPDPHLPGLDAVSMYKAGRKKAAG